MSGLDEQGSKELTIFSSFAEVCPWPIRLKSIQKREPSGQQGEPPEPDILCEIEGERPVAFEMVQIVDQGLAQRTNDQVRLQNLLREAYQSLSGKARSEVEKRCGNTLVHVAFRSTSSFTAKKNAISAITELLQEITPSFEGGITPKNRTSLTGAVEQVTVHRIRYTGLLFHVAAAGSYSDPTLENIRQKFMKQHKTRAPMELLAYYELQPVHPEDWWQSKLIMLITDHLKMSKSTFRRVWVFDVFSKAIKLVYPPPES